MYKLFYKITGSSIVKQEFCIYENHTRIRSRNQPVLS